MQSIHLMGSSHRRNIVSVTTQSSRWQVPDTGHTLVIILCALGRSYTGRQWTVDRCMCRVAGVVALAIMPTCVQSIK